MSLISAGSINTGIVFIEPALIRLIRHISSGNALSYPFTILIVYAILITLIIRERHQKRGRWVFPLVLGLYMVIHTIILLQIQIGPWETVARWFASLKLT
jgi:Ca2+/Na+ antiporter